MNRHPSTEHLLRFFDSSHLPPGAVQAITLQVGTFARDMVAQLPDGPELTAGLRKLLEAKDCFARSALDIGKDTP